VARNPRPTVLQSLYIRKHTRKPSNNNQLKIRADSDNGPVHIHGSIVDRPNKPETILEAMTNSNNKEPNSGNNIDTESGGVVRLYSSSNAAETIVVGMADLSLTGQGRTRSVAISRNDDGTAPQNSGTMFGIKYQDNEALNSLVQSTSTISPSRRNANSPGHQRPKSPSTKQPPNIPETGEPLSPVSVVGDLPSPRFNRFSPPLSPTSSSEDHKNVAFSPQPSPPMSPMSPYSPDVAYDKNSNSKKPKIAPLKMKGKGTIKASKAVNKKGKKDKKITDAFWWSSI